MTSSHRRSRAVAVVVALLGAVAFAPTRLVAAASAPTFVRTIGGPAMAATNPGGLDVDASGDVFVANTGNDTIAEWVPAQGGSYTLAWTRGIRGDTLAHGNFTDPRDVAVDASHLYVADTGAGIVQILGLDGTFQSRWVFPFRSPIGISVGTDGSGLAGPSHERILVSNGNTGIVNVFDGSRVHLFDIPPKLGSNAGTRDAATDPNTGDIYTDDYRHNAIQKYDSHGNWLLSWGGTGAPACQQVPGPYGVDVADDGTVYVAASNNNALRSFTPTGGCIRTYGTTGNGINDMSQLRRVAVSPGPSPLIYGADLWGIKVMVFNVDGSIAGRIGNWPKPGAGGFNEVHAVAVGGGYVFAADLANHRAERFALDGSGAIVWGAKGVGTNQAEFNWPQGAAYDPTTGHVWIVDTRNSDLKEFSASGAGPLSTRGKQGSAPGLFHWPDAMAFDAQGNSYVADTANSRIQSFTPAWGVRWTYGSRAAGPTNLRRPSAVAVGGGFVWIADTGNSRIVVLDAATGLQVSVLPIGIGSILGQISGPEGVAVQVDSTGTAVALWVADTLNHRIEKFNVDGSYAGSSVGGTGFGSGSTQFDHPCGLAMGPDGLLYVADAYNSRIQVFQP